MSSASSTIQVSGLAKEKLRTLHAQAKAVGMTAGPVVEAEVVALVEKARLGNGRTKKG